MSVIKEALELALKLNKSGWSHHNALFRKALEEEMENLEGIAQGRREAAEAYCNHICSSRDCTLECSEHKAILGTASKGKGKENENQP